jgi:hypothetical protein
MHKRTRQYYPKEAQIKRRLLSKSSARYLVDYHGKTHHSTQSSNTKQQYSNQRYSHMLTPEGNLRIMNTQLTPAQEVYYPTEPALQMPVYQITTQTENLNLKQ